MSGLSVELFNRYSVTLFRNKQSIAHRFTLSRDSRQDMNLSRLGYCDLVNYELSYLQTSYIGAVLNVP